MQSQGNINGFRYIFFPKLIPQLLCSAEVLTDIRFGENFAKPKFLYKSIYASELNNKDLESDELAFTLWAISFIGCYWYHNNQEKKV
jgi:hypothetical protein